MPYLYALLWNESHVSKSHIVRFLKTLLQYAMLEKISGMQPYRLVFHYASEFTDIESHFPKRDAAISNIFRHTRQLRRFDSREQIC